VTPDELKALLTKYGNTDQLAQSGVTIAGTRYMYLSSTDKVIRAKKGTSGVHTIKTTQGENWFMRRIQ
jgi:profilin